jgi:hypothetical protein
LNTASKDQSLFAEEGSSSKSVEILSCSQAVGLGELGLVDLAGQVDGILPHAD